MDADPHPLSPNGSLRPGFLDVSNVSPSAQWRDDASVASADSSVHNSKSAEALGLSKSQEALAKPEIHPMPKKPLHLLKRLVNLLKVRLSLLSKCSLVSAL